MTVGLPGTGIGGAFYLIAALLMPVREAMRRRPAGGPSRWRTAWRLSGLAAAVIAAVWATGWLAGYLVGLGRLYYSSPASPPAPGGHFSNFLRAATLAWLLGTLAVVLGAVELLRLAVRLLGRRVAPAGPSHPDESRPAGVALENFTSHQHGGVQEAL